VQTPGTWSAVATAPGNTCALDGQGALRCWGQFTLADDTGARFTAVSTAGDTGCGLHDDGSLWCWGKVPGDGALFSSRLASARRGGWASVAVGNDFICARKSAGAAACLHLPRKYAFLEPWVYLAEPTRVE
jgi:hypothetical protein